VSLEAVLSSDFIVPVAIVVIAFFSGFVHAAIGFGFGIVAVTLLPLVTDVRAAHVVISTASVPVIAAVAWKNRRGWDPVMLRDALLGAVVGLPLGLWAFEIVSAIWLVRVTGLAILAMIGMTLLNRKMKGGAGKTADVQGERSDAQTSFKPPCLAAGFVAAFLAGAISIAGPPLAAFGMRQAWTQERFKAFLNQFLLAVSVSKVAYLATRGYLDQPAMTSAAVMVPFAFLGTWFGAKLTARIPTEWFERIVIVALTLIALTYLK